MLRAAPPARRARHGVFGAMAQRASHLTALIKRGSTEKSCELKPLLIEKGWHSSQEQTKTSGWEAE